MPRFTTISPTHIPGKKEYAWRKFLEGGYVAIGWLGTPDFTGMPFDEIERIIRSKNFANEASAIESFRKFLKLDTGDYIGVNNANDGLFGVGVITSGYKFQPNKHDTGDSAEFYSHYREVKWLVTNYLKRASLIVEGETGWEPFGTVGKLYEKLPPYIGRLVGVEPQVSSGQEILEPEFLKPIIQSIEFLRNDPQHQEQAHVSLAEDFFVAVGYQKQRDIKHQQGRVDLTLALNGHTVAVVEVKRSWNLSPDNKEGLDAVKQAYAYAHDAGVRYVIVTNGDTYLFYDRLKGLSWQTNLFGAFSITLLKVDDLQVIERLRPENLNRPNLSELFQHISQSFQKQNQPLS